MQIPLEVIKLSKDYNGKDIWQVDQQFLAQVVYPMVKEDSVVHDPFFEDKPFPYPRDEKHFVGQAYAGTGRILDQDEYFQTFMMREMKL